MPTSLIATFFAFYWAGFTLNNLTLMAFSVSVGLLVDDAIIDVENVFRRLRENRERGSPVHPLLVVYRPSSEVRKPILVSTLLVVVVYFAVFFTSPTELPRGIVVYTA